MNLNLSGDAATKAFIQPVGKVVTKPSTEVRRLETLLNDLHESDKKDCQDQSG